MYAGVPLLCHAYLPHARECQVSAGTPVGISRTTDKHQPGRFCHASAESELRFGSGPGIRTLNLAVNRSLRLVQEWRPEFAECRRVPPFATVYRRRCCTGGSLFQFLAAVTEPETPNEARLTLAWGSSRSSLAPRPCAQPIG
jgi:hypothetical protein